MTSFAEVEITYPDGQDNVYEPPESVLANGFIPKQRGVRGMPLPANWLNWLFREIFRKINLESLTDGNGVGVVPQQNCFITISVMSKTDSTKFLDAIGYKTGAGVPVISVLNSSILALGTITATNIPIIGAPANTLIMRIVITESN